MICIIGESGSGKTELAKAFEKYGYERVITYTSRPKRDGEVDGEDYHFKNDSYFEIKGDDFLEISEYRGWKYGTKASDLHDKSVIVMTPAGMRRLKAWWGESVNGVNQLITVYLTVPAGQRLIKLLETRIDIDEIMRRYMTETGQFDGVSEEVDVMFSNCGYSLSPSNIAEHIICAYE